ncbi:SDR family oxidoreductase [Spongiactinospora sp. TRM90649]|uniref:SDR family oxidoreductase n=1 Tax=Spongiactinospora sp. TRM90649 TaxID=3031114 RepID=UPI0023F645DA|nr:SDR family oxidoreductase [Spongiactinospora sp. TRM90649]MDF5752281.1 SDR family oxidoreductase [Spongiactinospora sp. TRM90649]
MTTVRTALVTGANKGIGYEIVKRFGKEGVTAIIGARSEERGRKAAEELGTVHVRLDVTDQESAAAAAKWIEARYGGLDILVNNAGIMLEEGDPLTDPGAVDAMRRTYETNVFGLMTVTQAMLPLLRASQSARIVNVSSELGSFALATDPASTTYPHNYAAYNSSKSAVNMITVSMAKYLAGSRIKVNAVCPGYCATDLNGHSGHRTPAQGAVEPVRLALIGDDGPTGAYSQDTGPLPW